MHTRRYNAQLTGQTLQNTAHHAAKRPSPGEAAGGAALESLVRACWAAFPSTKPAGIW